ncbi:unnamed protein product [Dovyalis caffra]|uniref:Uncharacterized protein n=1 Tax=Dovyalis caffra TaxID=77055 RepID=A0AAV1QY01_9ROSI|nr:unnamed protein product [Dovyalis caffra]
MQDLGVCEDIICHDDFKIPDVDKTFCNFEELFGGDQDPIGAYLDGNDSSCFYIEEDMAIEKSNNSNGRARKVRNEESQVLICIDGHMTNGLGFWIQGVVHPICMSLHNRSVHIGNDKDPSNQAYNFSRSLDSPWTIRSPDVKSRSNEYPDSELLQYFTDVEAPCYSLDLESAHTEAQENAMIKYKEKKSLGCK